MNQTGFRFISGYTDYQGRYIYCYTLMTQALSMENIKFVIGKDRREDLRSVLNVKKNSNSLHLLHMCRQTS